MIHGLSTIFLTGRKLFAGAAAVMVLAANAWCFSAFADNGDLDSGWVWLDEEGWKYEENGANVTGWLKVNGIWYYFDEDGLMQTGWIQAADDQLWYYLDSETGAWIRTPSLDDTAVERLLENQIKQAGYYQNEDGDVFVQVDWRSDTTIYATVRVRTGPNTVTTLNNYEINKKTGSVTAAVGENFSIYQ